MTTHLRDDMLAIRFADRTIIVLRYYMHMHYYQRDFFPLGQSTRCMFGSGCAGDVGRRTAGSEGGLPLHIMCPLCGSREETIDHILLQCPLATAIWTGAITRLGLPNIVPSDHAELGEWWPLAVNCFAASDRRSAKSFISLVVRTLWLERNARVFDRKCTSAQVSLRLILDEWKAWMAYRHGSRREI
jgi:hypothetical protein